MIMESMTVETASMLPIAEGYGSSTLQQMGEDELDLCAGGARNAGSSTSGFSRNRMAVTKGTFANAEGAGTISSMMTEEVSSFGKEVWDIDQG